MKKQTRKQRRKQRQKILKKRLMAVFILILAIFIIYSIAKSVLQKDTEDNLVEAFSSIDKMFEIAQKSAIGNVTTYIVYGTHFNIEGNLSLPEQHEELNDVQIVAKNASDDEIVIDAKYTYENNTIKFSTLDTINTGLNLEELKVTDYYIFVKTIDINNQAKYYTLANDTEYGEINYYTLTRNNSNNKIYINFSKENDIPFLGLNVRTSELPENVYDVVIDPGHGGNDGGAVSGSYEEASIVLKTALNLKRELEKIGLKVLLTRDGTESSVEYTANNMYDENGRVTLANESGAKLLISLHLNSNEEKLSVGGVEVYAPTNCDLSFAKMLAQNIVSNANTNFSQMESYKKEEGVYVREIDVTSRKNSVNYSNRNYNAIFDEVPYLYILRETGGIATGAYVDGTSPRIF